MNRAATLLVAVLASGWFVPVSCSTATAVFAQLQAADSERPWTSNQPPQRFRVVAQPGEGKAPFRVLTLAELPELNAKPAQLSFLMQQDRGHLEDDAQHARVNYVVLARTPAVQEIEVEHEDGDDQSFSRYRATATGIEPLSTRYGAMSKGIVMMAVVEGFLAAIAIFIAALFLKVALRRSATPPPSLRP